MIFCRGSSPQVFSRNTRETSSPRRLNHSAFYCNSRRRVVRLLLLLLLQLRLRLLYLPLLMLRVVHAGHLPFHRHAVHAHAHRGRPCQPTLPHARREQTLTVYRQPSPSRPIVIRATLAACPAPHHHKREEYYASTNAHAYPGDLRPTAVTRIAAATATRHRKKKNW